MDDLKVLKAKFLNEMYEKSKKLQTLFYFFENYDIIYPIFRKINESERYVIY